MCQRANCPCGALWRCLRSLANAVHVPLWIQACFVGFLQSAAATIMLAIGLVVTIIVAFEPNNYPLPLWVKVCLSVIITLAIMTLAYQWICGYRKVVEDHDKFQRAKASFEKLSREDKLVLERLGTQTSIPASEVPPEQHTRLMACRFVTLEVMQTFLMLSDEYRRTIKRLIREWRRTTYGDSQ